MTFISASTKVWGAERSLLLTAHNWPTSPPPVLIGPEGEFTDLWQAENGEYSTIILPTETALSSRRFVAAISANTDALNNIRASQVIVINSLSLASLSVWLRHWNRSTIRVLDLHDYLPTKWGRFKLNLVATLFTRVLTISNFASSQIPLASWLGKVTVLTRPVAAVVPIPTTRERSTNELVISVIGRLDRDKRIELAIRAVALASGQITLSIRGASSNSNSDYELELRSLADRIAPDRVFFEGKIPSEDCFANLDAVIVTNHEEALGRTVLEAQAFGLPVVVPDRGGSAESVEHEETGLKYRSGDSEALAQQLQRLHSYVLRCDLSSGALEIARRRQSAAEYANAYSAAIHKVHSHDVTS